MGLKRIRIYTLTGRLFLTALMLLAVIGAFFSLKWAVGTGIALRAETVEDADLAVELGPSDPQTHFALAVLAERSFEPSEIERALQQYKAAVSFAPFNYLLWLELGQALERSGDRPGAEAALRTALKLAPNYSQVQWTLGNALVRQGNPAEGLALVRKAGNGSERFAGPAAAMIWQATDGDLSAAEAVIGDSALMNAALARILAREERFDDAIDVWRATSGLKQLPNVEKIRNAITSKLIAAGKYRFAFELQNELRDPPRRFGDVQNPGFELPVAKSNDDPFDWKIESGTNPNIVQSDGTFHSGRLSLLMVFRREPANARLRSIVQTVAVMPGKTYVLSAFVRSELAGTAPLRMVVDLAGTRKRSAQSEPILPSKDWTKITVQFAVPYDADGIMISFRRDACGSGSCSIIGNLWIDDLQLVRQD